MKYRTLGHTGLRVSVLGYGGSSLGGAFRDITVADGIRSVHVALENGVNYFDTSPYYGATKAETILGKALLGIPRDRYILATKVGQYGDGQFDFSAARVKRSVTESMERLGVSYIDVIQCHDIEFASLDQIVNETLPALYQLKRAGVVGHVGITGLPLKVLRAVLERTTVETVLSFCRYTLYDQSLLSLIPLCKQKHVGLINAAPTGMGLLTRRGPPAWHPASPAIKDGCRRAVEFCDARGVDIVKLAIQFCVAQPDIATTLIGTADPKNMLANIRYADEPLDQQLLADVLEVLKPIHNQFFTRGRPENRDD
jgi:L-galactose dehydrogenase